MKKELYDITTDNLAPPYEDYEFFKDCDPHLEQYSGSRLMEIWIDCGEKSWRRSWKQSVYCEFFKVMVDEEFLHPECKDMVLIKDNVAEILDSLASFRLPNIDKWGDLNNAWRPGIIRKSFDKPDCFDIPQFHVSFNSVGHTRKRRIKIWAKVIKKQSAEK